MYFYFCCILFLEEAVAQPEIISSKNGGKVREGHTVFLSDEAKDVEVYYTTDGSTPIIGESNTKRYTPGDGIKLVNTGLSFVRAVAKIKGLMPSKTLTSRSEFIDTLYILVTL